MSINFISYYLLMLVVGAFGSFLYIRSCMPAHLEKKIGAIAYERSAKQRYIASLVLSVSALYFACYNTPDIVDLQSKVSWLDNFPWAYTFSFIIAVIFGVLGATIFIKGRKALGKESTAPKKYNHVFSEGIYGKIRHPQHLGEICFWYALAFLISAPILVATVTFFWIPSYYLWCKFEEKDLMLRYGMEYKNYMNKTKMFIPNIF